ncbi:MAG: hypothetical protein VW683_10010 [Betaproteobacteria bacterium]
MTDALIHFPIYIGDALKKFIEYPTLKERGAWLSLCVALIQHDGRLNDDDSLYYKCMCFNDEDKQVLKQIISKCLSKTNGVYMCKEITALINKQKTLRDKRAEAGRKGGLKSRKDKQSLSKTKAKSKHSELETELEPNLDLESEQHNKPSYKMFDPKTYDWDKNIGDDLGSFGEIVKLTKNQNIAITGGVTYKQWIEKGYTQEDIIKGIQSVLDNGNGDKARSLSYFQPAVKEAYDDRMYLVGLKEKYGDIR